MRQANSYLKDLGVNTRVKLFNSEAGKAANFDYNQLDGTDAVAAIGSKDNVREFAMNNIAPNEEIANVLGWQLDEGDLNGWSGPEKSPEVKGEFTQYGLDEYGLIGISVSQTREVGKREFKNTSFEETAGFLIAHGAGHIANKTHNYPEQGGVMLPGEDMANLVRSSSDMTLRKASTSGTGNKFYRDAMRRRFSTNQPVDNYGRTPRQRHEYYRHAPNEN